MMVETRLPTKVLKLTCITVLQPAKDDGAVCTCEHSSKWNLKHILDMVARRFAPDNSKGGIVRHLSGTLEITSATCILPVVLIIQR